MPATIPSSPRDNSTLLKGSGEVFTRARVDAFAETALATSQSVQIYRQYVDAYGLVYDEGREGSVTFPAHEGSLDLQHAEPLGTSASPR